MIDDEKEVELPTPPEPVMIVETFTADIPQPIKESNLSVEKE